VTRYTEKQKLAAVTAYRKGAGGLRATASAHDVGVDSLRAWIAAYEANGKAGLVAKRVIVRRRPSLPDALAAGSI